MALGRAVINTIDLAINQDLKALFCKPNVDIRYLFHFLNAKSYLIESFGKGATVKGITLDVLRQLEVPLPPLPEQKRISAILDKADAIRRKRRQALAMADQFLRAVFLEMFGDPVTNPKGWDSGTIDDVAVPEKGAVRCGPFGTQLKVHELVSEGIPLLGIENVHDDKFVSDCKKFLTIEKAKDLDAFSVESGDLLITRMGTIGRACVVPENLGDARISYHLFRVRVDKTKCLPEFLSSTISHSGTFLDQLNRLAHGAIMSGLNTSILREVKFLIPPIALQQSFVDRTKQVLVHAKKLKLILRTGDHLFLSFTQRAFRGEL